MKREHVIAGAAVAIALLLPAARWALTARAAAGAEREWSARAQAAASAQRRADDPRSGSTRVAAGAPSRGGWNRQRARRSGWSHQRGHGIEEIAKALGLTAEQQNRIRSARESVRQVLSDVFRSPSATRAEKMAAAQAMRAAQEKTVAALLSPDQRVQYTAYQKQMQARWQANRAMWVNRAGGTHDGNGASDAGRGANG